MTKKRKTTKKVRRERGHWRDTNESRPLAPGHYLPVDPRLTTIVCPDCGANWEAPENQRRPGAGGALNHAESCPIARGYRETGDNDREWFDSNPEATQRIRPPTMAELQSIMLATGQALPDAPNGAVYEPGGQVIVTQVAPGLRERNFKDAVLLMAPALSPADGYHPDEFDVSGQMIFREHIGPSRLPGESKLNDDEMWQW